MKRPVVSNGAAHTDLSHEVERCSAEFAGLGRRSWVGEDLVDSFANDRLDFEFGALPQCPHSLLGRLFLQLTQFLGTDTRLLCSLQFLEH